MDLNLDGRVALVTGGSRGIGKEVARRLSREGAHVALLARDRDALAAAATEIRRSGGEVLVVQADTTNSLAVDDALAEVRNRWSGVDILVNAAAAAAGSRPPASIDAFDEALLKAELDTKVLGYVRVIRACVPHMIENGWGRVINVSGRNALVTGSLTGSVRNIGVAAVSGTLADELGHQGITVNTVHPGLTLTARTKSNIQARADAAGVGYDEMLKQLGQANSLRRLITAEEVAAVVSFLASPLSAAVTGASIEAGGGARGWIHY